MNGKSLAFLGCLLGGLATRSHATVLYQNDFEVAAGPEWSNPVIDTTPSGRDFLGRFANELVSLTLGSIPSHTFVSVEFDLYVIQSWDGNNTTFGPDVWDASVSGGPTLVHATFSNFTNFTQTYPASYPGGNNPAFTGASEVGTLGYTPFGDSVYHFSFLLPHAASSLTINFSGLGLNFAGLGGDTERWGLDNVLVSTDAPEPGVLLLLALGMGALGLGRTRSRGPRKELSQSPQSSRSRRRSRAGAVLPRWRSGRGGPSLRRLPSRAPRRRSRPEAAP